MHSFCNHIFTPYLVNNNYHFGAFVLRKELCQVLLRNHHHFVDNKTEAQGGALFLVTPGDSNLGRPWILHS